MSSRNTTSPISDYWVVSAPNAGSQQDSVLKLKHAVERRDIAKHFLIQLPNNLKIGTLDSLVSLSDELGKSDDDVAGALSKINRMYSDMSEAKEEVLYVKQMMPDSYIETFKWNAQQYSPNDSLLKIVETIKSIVGRNVANLTKIKATITAVKNKLDDIERKTSGSLLTRELHEFVKRSDYLDGPYICTELICVPKAKDAEWLSSYSKLETSETGMRLIQNGRDARAKLELADKPDDDGQQGPKLSAAQREKLEESIELGDKLNKLQAPIVVPNTSKKLAEDEDYSLYQVAILRKCGDLFGALCRERRYNVREFSFDDQTSKFDEKQKADLEKKAAKETTRLLLLCQTFYSDVFVGYMHLKMVRVFVESVLRYGLPVDFSVNLVKPSKGADKRLNKTLESLYAHLGGMSQGQGKKKKGRGNEDTDFTGLGADFRPYVFSKIHIVLS